MNIYEILYVQAILNSIVKIIKLLLLVLETTTLNTTPHLSRQRQCFFPLEGREVSAFCQTDKVLIPWILTGLMAVCSIILCCSIQKVVIGQSDFVMYFCPLILLVRFIFALEQTILMTSVCRILLSTYETKEIKFFCRKTWVLLFLKFVASVTAYWWDLTLLNLTLPANLHNDHIRLRISIQYKV